MKFAEKGGLTAILAKLFSPVMAKLFPDYEKDKSRRSSDLYEYHRKSSGIRKCRYAYGNRRYEGNGKGPEGGAAVCRGQWYGYVRGYQYRFSAIDPHNDVGFAGKPRRGLAI